MLVLVTTGLLVDLIGQDLKSYKEYIMERAPSQKEIEVFLSGKSWAKFDSELG